MDVQIIYLQEIYLAGTANLALLNAISSRCQLQVNNIPLHLRDRDRLLTCDKILPRDLDRMFETNLMIEMLRKCCIEQFDV